MDSEKKLDPVTVSSCIFLEDETAETTVESILVKVSYSAIDLHYCQYPRC
jgi:hypothetical protein